MRVIFLQAFLFVSIISSAQSDFYKQVKAVTADSPNGFLKFRSQPKLEKGDSDSTFFSIIQIEGTTKNEIYKLDTLGWAYSAVIVDSVKTNKAEKICDQWKEKIEATLGNQFSVKKYKVVDYNPSKHGWRFFNEDLSISIDVMPLYKEEKLCIVWLTFMN